MAIQFEFYKNPQPEKEGEEPSYHPRVVNFQHVTTQKLAREIHMATTFGKAEVEAMLMELSRCMGNHLCEGERVHLDGIGYFQVTLQATEPVHSLTTRADKVKLKSINFQADRDLKSYICSLWFSAVLSVFLFSFGQRPAKPVFPGRFRVFSTLPDG